jgi:hypothetical protein
MMRALHRISFQSLGFWLLVLLIALVAAGKAILYDTLDPDCFWHLRVAAQLHRDGIGPIVDDLSFASSRQPWTPYSWLAELGMKAVWDLGGYRAAIAVTAVMQGIIILLLGMCCVELQRLGKSPTFNADPFRSCSSLNLENCKLNAERLPNPRYLAAALSTAIGAYLILPYLSFRPVTAGFVLLFAIAWLLLRDQRISRTALRGWVWLVIPLTALLTNIHLFSFLVPAMIFAIAIGAAVERDARLATRYALLATAASLACLATPMLPGLVKTIFFYSTRDKMVTGPVIAEMRTMGPVTALGVMAMLSCIAIRYRAVPVGQLICIAAATLLVFKLGRFAPLFALAACPALAATLPGLKDRLLAKPAILTALGLIVAMGGYRIFRAFPARSVSLSSWVNRHGVGTPGYPCAAADFVDRSVDHQSGHLINEFSWGGYLAWRLGDKYQVLIDGRTQVYPQAVWQATYLGSEREQSEYLASLTADAALVPTGNSKFRDSLIKLGWRSVYQDERAEVLVPPTAAGVARIE